MVIIIIAWVAVKSEYLLLHCLGNVSLVFAPLDRADFGF